jgi:dTDP-glucose 4,6-dehydratase
LGWRPREAFESGLAATVRWYAANEPWWRQVRSEHFEAYYRRQYAARGLA